MYQLSDEQKRYLLHNNKEVRASTLSKATAARSNPQTNVQASTYGPASATALLPRLVPQLTGDSGIMKRLSIAGWAIGTSSPALNSAELDRNSGEFGTRRRDSTGPGTLSSNQAVEAASPVIQPQGTGGLWSSWWTSSGGEKGAATKQMEKTAKWFADGIRNCKSSDAKLVKHLISLRVHVSTANLAWIEDFVGTEKGMDALGKLLASLVGKGGKRKKLTSIEDTVLLEVIKCFRVLLNTEVRQAPHGMLGLLIPS